MLSTAAILSALSWAWPYVAGALGLLGLAGGAWLKGKRGAERQQDQATADARKDQLEKAMAHDHSPDAVTDRLRGGKL